MLSTKIVYNYFNFFLISKTFSTFCTKLNVLNLFVLETVGTELLLITIFRFYGTKQ